MKFLKQIRETVEYYGMVQQGDKVIIGVSGGPDSMALLFSFFYLQKHYNLSLLAAHYNHRLRGKESDQDAEFVKTQIKRFGIPLLFEEDNGSLLRTQKNLEENARKKRYDFFQKKALEYNAQKIALGHTADDQVETFFLWLLRGTGTKGLGGIPPVRDNLIIRPFIETERKEVMIFLKQNRIPWREDSSNQNLTFLRNRIRKILIPKLIADFKTDLAEKVTKTTKIFREDDQYLEKQTLDIFTNIMKYNEKKDIIFEIEKITELPVSLKRRTIRLAIENISGSLRKITFEHIEKIIKLLSSSRPHLKLSLPNGLVVQKDYSLLKFKGKLNKKINFYYEFNYLPETIKIPEIGRKIKLKLIDWNPLLDPLTDQNTALIDFEKINFPIIVRNRKNGDLFQPLGTKGSKKIKDFFMDIKTPREERQQVPIVIFGNFIAWIAGKRIDNRVKVTKLTRKAIKMVII